MVSQDVVRRKCQKKAKRRPFGRCPVCQGRTIKRVAHSEAEGYHVLKTCQGWVQDLVGRFRSCEFQKRMYWSGGGKADTHAGPDQGRGGRAEVGTLHSDAARAGSTPAPTTEVKPSLIETMWAAVVADPEDWTAKGALADLLDERGLEGDHATAVGLRWCLKRHKHPHWFSDAGFYSWMPGETGRLRTCLGTLWTYLSETGSGPWIQPLFKVVGDACLRLQDLIST